ncbi:MAG: ferrous iron transport protein A [Tenericutes bacterium]|nr:ferrous iron transport protein A [Mycoplasmatota bacterium]
MIPKRKRVVVVKTLNLCERNQEYVIKSLHGNCQTNLFLENLGLLPNETIVIITELGSNYVISVNGVRLGIDRSIAKLIEVQT